MVHETPRIPALDMDWALELLPFLQVRRGAMRAELASGAGGQVGWAFQADYCFDLALLRCALGAPAAEVRAGLEEASHAVLEVFKRRGTTGGLPLDGPAAGPAPIVDDSLSSAREGLRGLQAALAAGARELAVSLAALLPEAAEDDEAGRLAHAFGAALKGEAVVLPLTSRVLATQARMLEALSRKDGGAFSAALQARLAWYKAQYRRVENLQEPRWFLDLPALALARMALDAALPGLAPLPAGLPFFPLELLREGA